MPPLAEWRFEEGTSGWRVGDSRLVRERRRLAAQVENWRQFVTVAGLPEDAEAAEGMSPQELERLRSPGYVQ